MLEWVSKLSRRSINPKTVTCAFELALINAIQGIFMYAKINGCLFHWKQAIQRKLILLKFANKREILEIAMHKNSINVLTLIPANESKTKWVPLWRTILKKPRRWQQKKNHFWDYFDMYWMSSDSMADAWNINNYVGIKNTLKHTNYGLTRKVQQIDEIFV